MLIPYSQFQLQQAVKSSAHLLHPRTVLQTNMKMPQGSMIHYLDLQSDAQFPARDMVYLSGIPENKRVPIFHVTDLLTKTEVQLLQERLLSKKIREWQRGHMQAFRPWELLQVPNPDRLTNGVINYNLLKNLYKYKNTLTSSHSRYMDLMGTYWSTVAQAIQASAQTHHFVSIPVPKALPSRSLINKILEFSAGRYARVVTNPELNGILQLYRYLDPKSRSASTMASLPESAGENLTIEFTYRGYSVFCKLSYLSALHKDSVLPGKIKLTTERLHQVFLLMLLKIQNIVEEKIQGTNPELLTQDEMDSSAEDTPVVLGDVSELQEQALQEDEEDHAPEPLQQAQLSQIEADLIKSKVSASDTAALAPGKVKEINIDTAFDDQKLDLSDLEHLLDSGLKEYEGGSDDLFIKAVTKAAQAPEYQADESEEEKEQAVVDLHAVDYSEENVAKLLKAPTIDERFEDFILEAKSFDAISTAEARTLRKTFEKRKTLVSPYSKDQIDQYKQITPKELELPDTSIPLNNNLVEDHLKHEVLFNYDKKYIQGPLRKHLVACVTALERNDLIVKDYQVEEISQSTGKYEIHKLTLKPLRGKESQVYFRIPVINDEGEYVAGGVRYRIRRQRASQILAKMSPIKVGITSNYNKLFISRTERKAFDPYANIAEQIKTDYLDGKGNITKIAPGNRFDNQQHLPNIYAAMSQHFNDVSTADYRFFFNHRDTAKHIDEKTIKELQSKSLTFVGHDKQSHVLVMDKSEMIYDYSDSMKEVGVLESLLGLNQDKIPQAFTTIKILGDSVPLGVMLSYYMGLKNLVAVTRSTMKVYPPNARISTSSKNEVMLKFANAKIVIECPNQNATLLFAGFAFYKNFIKTQQLESFYEKNVYLDLLESRDCSLMHLKEMDMLKDNFIDPITEDSLKAMNEPTEFLPLLLRANQLLEDFHHPDINDPSISRIRSYDRVPGLVYRALTESIRTQRMKGGKGKIELDPYKVWKYVTQDTTVKITEDNNPITDVKEVESATFSGVDGLSRTATPEKLRKYHRNDAGLISEATVDSSDVGLNFSLSPYAKVGSLLGEVDMTSTKHEEHPDLIFSTSVHLSPFSEYDDPKRIIELI